MAYACTGFHTMVNLNTSSIETLLATNDLGLETQVAFITAGCTYTTYNKCLTQVLGIKAVDASRFIKTIQILHPIVEGLINELCEKEKKRMQSIPDEEMGSWKRAVTCADGTWMTRGWFSKNATFSIRNYFTGGLLYFKHVCQKGRDKIISEELYKGTSKSAEGYAASR